DALLERVGRPVVGGNRRVDHHLHGGGADDEAVLRERVEGVAEDDRHDRHARAHRHVEGALLERAETKGGAARALRRDDERGALPSSPQAVIARFTMSRRLRFRRPGIAPTPKAGMMLAIASDERTISPRLGRPRPVKRWTGQPRRRATAASRRLGFVGRAWPTISSSGRSSWLSV